MTTGFAVFNAVMLPLYLVSAAVQYNDPDPVSWMLIYGAAAACCVAALLGRLRWPLSAAVAVIAFTWALWLAPTAVGHTTLAEMFAGWKMTDMSEATEAGREMGGLLIVTVGMVIQVVILRRRALTSAG